MNLKTKNFRWFSDHVFNFISDAETVVVSSETYASLRAGLSNDQFGMNGDTESLRSGYMGTLFGCRLRISGQQPGYWVTVHRKDGQVHTLCDQHSWSSGDICLYDECLVKWVHSR